MYQAAHVPGAGSLPATAVAALAERLPADRGAPVVLYGPGGCLAPTTALRVKQLGYTDVKIYPLGLADWVATEYSVTTPKWLRRALDDALGVIVIDVREPQDARAGHIRGAVNIPLDDFVASRDLFPPVPKAPIVVYGEDAAQAARQLVDWGYRAVRLLPMSYADWAAAGHPVASGPSAEVIVYDPKPKPGAIRVADFTALAKAPRDGLTLVDLRDEHEIWLPSVAHAVNIPFRELAERMETLPPARIPVFYCPTGARAAMAHSIFANAGRESRFLEPGATVDAEGKVRLVGR
jgi:rhodanese-related sulfurtransferase